MTYNILKSVDQSEVSIISTDQSEASITSNDQSEASITYDALDDCHDVVTDRHLENDKVLQ